MWDLGIVKQVLGKYMVNGYVDLSGKRISHPDIDHQMSRV